MSLAVADSALDEMEYRTGQGSFGQDMSVSIPAQLRFIETPTQITRRFHVELRRRGYSPIDSDPTRRHPDSKPVSLFYDGEIASRDHWDRMRVYMGRGDIIRLYPHDGWEVKLYELADIIEAIETAFGAEVEHHPIESENDEHADENVDGDSK